MFLLLLLFTGQATVFPDQDNVLSDASFQANNSKVVYLGIASRVEDCQQLFGVGCTSCTSFSWISITYPSKFAQGCYGRIDGLWKPAPTTGVFSGCSGSSCSVYVDPLHPLFHPCPAHNWMNDPNGPIYYNGLYHLLMQYNPYGSQWGSMSWYHLTSPDLVHWTNQPVALYPDQSYDADGVFSGSAVNVNGAITLFYTCVNDAGEQQCIATPKDPQDQNLVEWVKSSSNPIIRNPPPGGNLNDFRDPTTPWQSGSKWYMLFGSGINGVGAAYLYQAADTTFTSLTPVHIFWTLGSSWGGMWECPDFYPLLSNNGSTVYVTKFSMNGDWYAVGQYDESNQVFLPGTAVRKYDYGTFYASKTFFDPAKKRQVLWGWVSEDGGPAANNGWQGIQTFGRIVSYDDELQQLIYTPVPEVSLLYLQSWSTSNINLLPSQTEKLVVQGNQLEASFQFSFNRTGPNLFGVSVLQSFDLSQSTDITVNIPNAAIGPLNNIDMPGDEYRQFYYDNNTTEDQRISICQQTCVNESITQGCVAWTYVRQGGLTEDPSPRCSLKNGIPPQNPNTLCVSGVLNIPTVTIDRSKSGSGNTSPFTSTVQLKEGEGLFSLLLHVDHSLVETYAQGGRAVISARVYPSPSSLSISVFNRGPSAIGVADARVSQLGSSWTWE